GTTVWLAFSATVSSNVHAGRTATLNFFTARRMTEEGETFHAQRQTFNVSRKEIRGRVPANFERWTFPLRRGEKFSSASSVVRLRMISHPVGRRSNGTPRLMLS